MAHVVDTDAQALAGIGQEISEEDVGVADQVHEDRVRARVFQRQADAAFTPVGMFHERLERALGCAAGPDLQPTLGVTGDRVFDLDNLGAPVGQDGAGGGYKGELRDLHNLHAAHRLQHHVLLLSYRLAPDRTRPLRLRHIHRS